MHSKIFEEAFDADMGRTRHVEELAASIDEAHAAGRLLDASQYDMADLQVAYATSRR